VESVTFDAGNTAFKVHSEGFITNAAGNELALVMPSATGTFTLNDSKITKIGTGAFSGCSDLNAVELPYVTSIGAYAFAGCDRLRSASFGNLTEIGSYAFAESALTRHPDLTGAAIGDYAFSGSRLESVNVPDNAVVGTGAFANCGSLKSVTIGNNVTLGEKAFYLDYNQNWTFGSYDENGTRYYYAVFTSPLHSLTIGENVQIGDYAFAGAAELESVTMGSGAAIGNYAFYNATRLSAIYLSGAVSVGDYAFSGDQMYLSLDSNFTSYAVDEDGFYIYSYHAPALETVDLSAATGLGKYAFSNCRSLTSVDLGSITVLPEAAFNGCVSLKKIDLSGVTELGKYALSETVVESADLSSATVIGDYAFYNNTVLASVTLNPTGATAGEAAFGYCHSLSDLENEQFLTSVGDYAFAYTALTEADLSAAEYIGQYAFIKEELTKFDITLGNALKELGDNPFALCDTGAFKLENTVSFNGKDYTSPNYNYTISDTVQVIEGSLYQSVPNGLELVTFASDAKTITVAGSTVRIAAMAFAGSGAEQVKLPYTVYSIGHKAFYGCDRLEYVAFTSYNAPVLEEEYDFTYYASGNSLAATGEYAIIGADGKTETTHTGLGIVPYFMWNAVETPSCVYYGASFLDYIGHIEEPITMVRPINGRNYDSFIFGQYFSSVIDGAAAADPATVRVIDAINALPDTVSLIDKALVAEARRLYDLISTLEQKALVTNYVKLTQAEKRISDLEYLENSGSAVPPDTTIPGNDSNTAGYIVMAVAVIIAVLTPILFLLQKKKKSSSAETPCETEPSEEQHEENT